MDLTQELGRQYSFKELEYLLNNQHHTKYSFFKVYNVENKSYALMTVFRENFSQSYLSGDGVLFYDNGETHSSDEHDVFTLIDFIKIG